jgi:tripartite-type tricarboxylate transporter receptor subunit TctC
LKKLSALGSYLIVLVLLGCGVANAQSNYPSKPIRLVTAGAGGGTDFSARIIAQGLSESLGVQVYVENQGGGTGAVIVAAQNVASSPPDGYTLLLYPSNLWLMPYLVDNVPYDPIKDFAPISMTDASPTVLFVNPSLGVKTVSDLVSLVKSKPGTFNYSQSSVGSPADLAMKMFIAQTGMKMTKVSYDGGKNATLAVASGEVQVSIQSLGSTAELIKGGRLVPLAVTSLERSPLLPDVPTMNESGFPGFESVIANGMFAPAGTPADIITKLNQELVKVLQKPDVKEKYLTTGALTISSSPEEFGAFVKADMEKGGKTLKDAANAP